MVRFEEFKIKIKWHILNVVYPRPEEINVEPTKKQLLPM